MPTSLRATALGYLLYRAGFRIASFFDHWYRGGTYAFIVHATALLKRLDQTLAVRITLRNLTRPLYNDYSIVGRIIGPVFRIIRVAIGVLLYALIAAVVAVLYILWLLTPPIIIFHAAQGLF